MREWIETELWDECYFRPERLGPKSVLYATNFSGPLVGLLIDGHSTNAPWRMDDLFTRLRPLAERCPCSWLYITDPDDALSVFQWEQPYNADWFTRRRLWVFETSPADEGGMCNLILAFHDRRGIIVFAFHPGHSFEISFYGHPERLAEIHECV
jgi:hypothetical protein